MKWLNSWERNLNKNVIKKDNFLTKQTSEGLRITIKSTIDLSNYLLNNCGFQYVLINKFNLDCLEVKLLLIDFKIYLKLLIFVLEIFWYHRTDFRPKRPSFDTDISTNI